MKPPNKFDGFYEKIIIIFYFSSIFQNNHQKVLDYYELFSFVTISVMSYIRPSDSSMST
jgi:hypothetical protein